MVDLSRQMLNRGAAAYLRQCADAAQRGEILSVAPTTPTVYTAPKRHLSDRLTAAELDQLVADYRAGVRRRDLAAHYGISMSSVARLLRRRKALRRVADKTGN